jgi:hypothetical protein
MHLSCPFCVIELWFAASKTLRNTVELMFRHCLRVILNDVGRIPVLYNVYLHVNSNVLPLSMTFQLIVGQMIFKVLTYDTCPPIRQLLVPQSLSCPNRGDLRKTNIIKEPFLRLESSRNCLSFYGSRLWNHLQPDLRDTERLAVFRDKYWQFLFDCLTNSTSVPDTVKFYDYV